jgi:hypothetical protein
VVGELFGRGGKARRGAGKGADQGEEQPGGGSGFDGLVLDESFIKGATVKEESARTRQLREQWKKEPPPPAQPWRSWEGEALQHKMTQMSAQVAAERAQAGKPSNPGKPRRRGRIRVLRTVTVAGVVLALAVGIRNFYSGRDIQPVATAPAVNPSLTAMPTATDVRASVAPTGDCLVGEPGCGSMNQPYAGSPALTWADGAAGITLPTAAAAGDFSSAQVAAALALSKEFVVDQALVPNVLVGGAPPSAMLQLITPDSGYPAKITSWIAAPSQSQDPTGTFVRFDPKNSALITAPKVSGTVTYSQVQAGELRVDLSLKIVYALEKPDGSDWTRTMATVDDELQYYNGAGDFEPNTGTVWPTQVWISSYAGAQCGSVGGFQEPWYLLEQNGSLPGGSVVDPYATSTVPATPGAAGTTCNEVSRL